ncbi:hypothetical protein PQV03_10060 [Thermoanaerobacterium thermosaccharolyticum]|jgi:hypothetical protein|uniref:hypothetical protein n=1 Tax=Thermoanaerobacterium thermosaccharolyticum TaxID=1517 RepID=UPI003D2D1A79
MDTLKLSKPIMINGEEVKEIKYDLDSLTAQDLQNASRKYQKNGGVIQVQELDSVYHLYLFAEAVAKVNPEIDLTDILRLSAKDAIKAESLVRNFFFLDLEDSSQSNTSETRLLN